MDRTWTLPDVHALLDDIDFRRLDELPPDEAAGLLEFVEAADFPDKTALLAKLLTDAVESPYVYSKASGYCGDPKGPLRETRLSALIEAAGGSYEWHDEWTVCSYCDKAGIQYAAAFIFDL